MPWLSCPIHPYKHGVVVVRRLVYKPPVGKGIQHVLVDAPPPQQVAVNPAHILMLRGQFQRLSGEGFHGSLHRSDPHGQHELHRFRVVHAVKPAGKVDGISPNLLVLMKPQVAPDGHLLPMIQPHIFRAGLLHFLSALPQERCQVCPSGLFPLLLCKRYIAHFTS